MYQNQKRLLAVSTLSLFLFSNVASAADHFILDGTTVDYNLSIDGNDDLTIKQAGGNGITVADTTGDVTVDGAFTVSGSSATITDGTLSVTEDSAATNTVVDVASISASSSGTVANSFGVGITFDAEDLGGIEEQGSIDLVFTDVTDASEDSQFVISVQEAGTITPELTISGGGITLGSGASVDNIETTLTDDDTHLPTSGAIVDYVTANGDDLGDHTATQDIDLQTNDLIGTTAGINFNNFDVVGASGNTNIGGTLDVTGDTGIDGDFDINTTAFTVTASNGNTAVGGTLGVTGNFDVNTTAFTVIAASGNTAVGGTLDVTGDLDVNSNFTVTAASGNTNIGGTLDVTGALTAASIDLGSSTVVSSVLDEDDFNSDSATALATQQSIKAYVDSEVGGISANTLDGAYDEGGAGAGRTVTVDTGAVVLDGSNAADETLEVSRETAATNTVIDAMLIQTETSGSAANNLGAGIVFNVEDAGGIEEQASLDVVVTNVSDTSEESEFVFNVQDAGAIATRLTVGGDGITLTSGATVDDIETTLTDDDTNLPTSGAIVDYVAANGDDLGNHTATQDLDLADNDLIGTTAGINFNNFDVVGASGNTDIGGTLDVAGDFDVNSNFTVTASNGNTDVGGTLTAAGNTIVTDGTLSVTDDNAATAAVVDVLSLNASSTGTVAADFGVGITFDAEDLGGIEEQGSIDLVFTDVTDASEDSELDFRVREAGTIGTELTVSGGGITLASGATVNDIVTTVVDDDTKLPTSGAVFDYVASEISTGSVFEAGDTGSNSVQANNGSADGNGDYSLAVGSGTTNGNYSLAYGFGTTAAGADSTAGGNATTATGNGSVAIGVDGEAKSFGEVVLGIFADGAGYTANSTTAHNSADRLFVLGNGTGSGARDNALVIGKDNDAEAAGNWDFAGISLAGGSVMTSILDEDAMGSDSATALATQQSIKAYVDTEIAGVTYTAGDGLTLTAQDFDVNVDGTSIEIATDTLQIAADGVTATELADDAVDTDAIVDGNVTLAKLAGALILTDAEDTGDNLGGGSATAVATTDAVKTYVDDQVGGISANTLDGAYDEGGAGSGRVITVDSGAVDFDGENASAPTIIARRDNSAQNSVQDVAYFEVTSSGGAGLNGIGAGLAFYVEDGGDTEEQASIDAVMTDVTNTAEESEINFSVQSAGTITEIATVDSGGFDVTGNITATGTITSSSDATLKTNINPLQNALASVIQIDGVSFDWLGGEQTESGSNVGVIAQNIQTVYPELVGENEAGLTVNYAGLVAPLIEAVKELKEEKDAEIEALQTQIAELQAQLSE